MKVNLTGLFISGIIPHSKQAASGTLQYIGPRIEQDVSGTFQFTEHLANCFGKKIEYLDIRLHGILITEYSEPEQTIKFTADTYTISEAMVDSAVDTEFGAMLKKAYREPHINDLFKHHNGNEYVVTCRANDSSDRPDYPVTIVYRGRNGKTWAKPETNFVQKMTFVRALTQAEVKNFFQG